MSTAEEFDDAATSEATVLTEADTNVVPETAPAGVGQCLRLAREERGLSVFEVAQSLKFGVRQIEALEAEDFSALPGATFLRGFVRSYARLLKLDERALLDLLTDAAPVSPPDVRPPQNMGVASSPVATARQSSSPMILGALALAVIASGLGLWHWVGGPTPSVLMRPSANGGEKIAKESVAVQAPEARVETAPQSAVVAEPQATPVLGPDMRQMVFSVDEKSWIEVIDAGQRVLLRGEYVAGSKQVAAGKPPFQLVIGNAAKVALQYDDRQIDLKPYTRAEVARFTLE